MNALEFLRDTAQAKPLPIYVVHGEDAYLRHEAQRAIVGIALGPEADELSVTRFPGDRADLAKVLDEVRTLPFLATRRVAVVEGADPFVTAHRKNLESYAEHPAESGTLVLVTRSWPGNTKLARIVSKTGLAIDCASPRESELPRWIARAAREEHDVRIEDDAARLLVELAGTEIGVISSELEKLAVYVGDRKLIRAEDVGRMVGAGRVEAVWRTIEQATTGRGAEALIDLDRLFTSGEDPFRILGGIAFSMRKVYHAGLLRRQRREHADACREAGITYPAAIDLTRRQHAHLGPGRVDRLPETLLRADLDIKGDSRLPPRVIVERLLLRLSMPRED